MGKQVTKKAAETAVKKSGGTRMKAPSLAKKSEKKKAENSSAADLRQPKDRDPLQERVDLLLPDLKKLYDVGLLTSDIFDLAVDYSQRHEMGNELFRAWYDDYLLCWNQKCDRFDAPFNDHFGSYTCEQKVDQIFQELDNSWDQVFRFLITCFDIDNVEKHKDEYMWSVRCLGMRVAQQEPFAFFDINQAGNSDDPPNSTYWSHEVPGNPRLTHEFSMVAFWMMCSMIFDHPWAHTYNSNRGTEDEYLITSLEVCNIRDNAYALLRQVQESQIPVFKAPEPKPRSGKKFFIEDISTEQKAVLQEAPAGDQASSSPSPGIQILTIDDDDEDEDVEIIDDGEDEEEADDSTVDGDGKASATVADPEVGDREDNETSGSPNDQQPKADDGDEDEGWGWKKLEEEIEPPPTHTASMISKNDGDPALGDGAPSAAPSPTRPTNVVNKTQLAKPARTVGRVTLAAPTIQTEVVTTSNEDKAISEMTGATGTDKDQDMSTTPARQTAAIGPAKSPAKMSVDSPPKQRRLVHPSIPGPTKLASRIAPLFKQPAKKTSKATITSTKKVAKIKRKMTIEERLTSFRQLNLEGIEGDCHYFDVSFAMTFNGDKAGGGSSLGQQWHKYLIETLGELISDADHGLRILPTGDNQYTDTDQWIRTRADLKRLIPRYRDLAKYMDKEYQNGPYLLSNSKPGEKKFRTRMLFGFDSGVTRETIQNYVHESLKAQGRFCGCFPSPLQYGAIEKIGALCFYPREIDFRSIEKELMRKFDWKVPIGLRLDWVSMPYDNRTKWNERSPGLMIWHIYVRVKDSHKVDLVMRQWLHPSTPKSELPWAAVVVYISDWKAAQRGTISVRAYGPVKEQILTMVSKNRDFQDLTVVLYADIEIPGMLKKAPTRLFGSSTFLKLLLSIKATPAQADKAAAAGPTTPAKNNMDVDGDDESDDEEGFTKVKTAGSRRRKKSSPSLSSLLGELDQVSPAQRKAAEEAELKRQRDLDNHRPSPLFLMVLPGEMAGSYIFVCRLKYQALAQNVLNGLVPFFTFHLQETFDAVNDKILAKWVSKSAVYQARRRKLYWCTKDLRAKEANAAGGNVDEGLEFLDGFGEDPTDVFDGTLEFDLEMADAKDIDDGATVAGALDELRDKEAQLDDAFAEIAVKDTQLEEARLRSASKEAQLEEERQRNASLQAELARLRKEASKPANLAPTPTSVSTPTDPTLAVTSTAQPPAGPSPPIPTVSPADPPMPAPPPKLPTTGKRPTPPSPANSVTRQGTVATEASSVSATTVSSSGTPVSAKARSAPRRKLHPYFSRHTPEKEPPGSTQGQPRGQSAEAP